MSSCEGQQLIAVGTAIAFQISQHASVDDMVLLGSLLNVIRGTAGSAGYYQRTGRKEPAFL